MEKLLIYNRTESIKYLTKSIIYVRSTWKKTNTLLKRIKEKPVHTKIYFSLKAEFNIIKIPTLLI